MPAACWPGRESSWLDTSLKRADVGDGGAAVPRRNLHCIRRHVLLPAAADLKYLIVGEVDGMFRQERRRRREPAHGNRAVTFARAAVTGLAVNLIDHRARPCRRLRGLSWNRALRRQLQRLAIGDPGVRGERLVGGGADHFRHGLPVTARGIVTQAEIGSHQSNQHGDQKEIQFHAATSCSRSSMRMAWCSCRNCPISWTSKAALSSSSTSAKRSLVTRGSSSVGLRPGHSRLMPKNASTVLIPANNTITSKVIGTKAGSEFQGLD